MDLINTVICWLSVIFFSSLLGGFLTSLSYRLPVMLLNKNNCSEINLFKPGSHCPNCSIPIKWKYKIPLFGFFLTKGICVNCKQAIEKHYIITELFFVIVTMFLFAIYGLSSVFLAIFSFSFISLALALIDMRYFLLPDILVFILLVAGLITNYFDILITFEQAIWGCIFGFSVFWCIGFIYKLLTNRVGMGFGDVKLMAALGVWTGVSGIPVIMLIASLTLIIYSLITENRQKKRSFFKQRMPFGPFLLLGAFISILLIKHIQYFL